MPNSRQAPQDTNRFVILSGLSGAGKSTAIKILEDLGFYCVDNLPITLIATFADLVTTSSEGPRRVALGIDIREQEFLAEFPRIFRALRQSMSVELLFLESSPRILLRRFSETRRRHPLHPDGPLAVSIRNEIAAMKPIRSLADRIIDTSEITVHDLKKILSASYGLKEPGGGVPITLVSFGYRYGVPVDVEIVVDVRFLPNPHFVAALRPYGGRNPRVRKFVLEAVETHNFLARFEDFLLYLLPLYVAEGKSYVSIGIGCTGGRHRSVVVTEEMRRRLAAQGYVVSAQHRDMEKET